jgi:hypothetical protein
MAMAVILPRIKYGINSSRNPEKHWIPPYQVRGRLSQTRNDKLYKTYVVMYKCPLTLALSPEPGERVG